MENRVKKPSISDDLAIDVQQLIEGRLLLQANSGGGKSWGLRRLCEQTYGHAPQIVLDPEGEFHTLRERYDYILAAPRGGDCVADIRSAALLARKLLELGASAIVDIYDLGSQRVLFVRRFLESLMSAPRELWHPLIVVVDEAHKFCPEKDQAESAAAVIDLMSTGRKRGFAGILATQRIAKLHKDAAAECNNKLIGRAAIDVDRKRAAEELGFTTKEQILGLRNLKAGEFFAFGPALSEEVVQIKVGPVVTTHPRAGARAAVPTPPREAVKKVLAQLADLPHEAEEEAKTLGEFRAKVKSLEAELRAAKKAQPAAEVKVVEKSVISEKVLQRIGVLIEQGDSLIERWVKASGAAYEALTAIEKKADSWFGNLNGELELLRGAVASTKQPSVAPPRPAAAVATGARVYPSKHAAVRTPVPAPAAAALAGAAADLPRGEAATLDALIQYPDGLARSQLTVLTGYKRSSRDAYIFRLKERGFVATAGDRVQATEAGIAARPNAQPLPTGEELQRFWFAQLPEGERKVLELLVSVYPEAVEKPSIDERTGYQRSSRDAYIARLRAKQLVEDVGRGAVKASATLFEVAA